MNKLEKKVLRRISPSKKDKDKLEKFTEKLTKTAKEVSNEEVIICGSTGKQTWLKGDHDIDLFILLPKKMSRKELEKRGLEYGKKIAKELNSEPKIKYAEHPYVMFSSNGFDIDIVPCHQMEMGGKIKSAVDRSPLHLEYVNKKLNPGLREDVRLLKQFMKGAEVYGSDSKNQGFSGYICELLVINYGRFHDVLKAIKKWQAPKLISIEDVEKPYLKKKFKNQPLILLDPVDHERNAAAVVSSKNFFELTKMAERYLKKQKMSFFFPKKKHLLKKEIKQLKKRETKFLALELKKPDILDDILYPQLRRLKNRISKLLEEHEFKLIHSFTYCNKKCYLLFEFEIWSLPKAEKIEGPPIFSKEVDNFYSKYQESTFIEGNRIMAEVERDFKNATNLIKDFTEKKNLKEEGVPSKLVDSVKTSKIIEHEKFWTKIEKNKELSNCLKKKYF